MNTPRSRLAALTVLCSLVLAACGGGGSDDDPAPTPPPPSGPTAAERGAAAEATADTNPMCDVATLGSYYWEVGNADGVLASGSVGENAPTAQTRMWVYSASKWLYAASVLQKRGSVVEADVPFLNFTSGYSEFGNLPVCLLSDTVEGCLVGRGGQDPETIGRFSYDSGHMQHHAVTAMDLGADDDAALAADLNATLGDFGFSYTVPQLAAGVVVTPEGYGGVLRKFLRNELVMGSALGTHKVCTSPDLAGCDAAFEPDGENTEEAWNYSLGHWVEDDPSVGDHAYSSPGGGGFYPWIDSSKTTYGIVARERNNEGDAGFHSAECGRLIRQAYRTGSTVTETKPTPP